MSFGNFGFGSGGGGLKAGTVVVQPTGYNANTNTPDLDTSPSGIKAGYSYFVTVAGTFFTEAVEAGDNLIALQDDPTTLAHWCVVQKNLFQATESVVGYSRFATDAETLAGTNTVAGITPKNLQSRITDISQGSNSENKMVVLNLLGKIAGINLSYDDVTIDNKGELVYWNGTDTKMNELMVTSWGGTDTGDDIILSNGTISNGIITSSGVGNISMNEGGSVTNITFTAGTKYLVSKVLLNITGNSSYLKYTDNQYTDPVLVGTNKSGEYVYSLAVENKQILDIEFQTATPQSNYIRFYSSNPINDGGIRLSGSINKSLIPTADVTYDLGSATFKWKDLYLSGATIYLGTDTLSVSGGVLKFNGQTVDDWLVDGSTSALKPRDPSAPNTLISSASTTYTVDGEPQTSVAVGEYDADTQGANIDWNVGGYLENAMITNADNFNLGNYNTDASTPYVVSSSSELSGTYAGWKAYDGSQVTVWSSSENAGTGTLTINLGSALTFVAYKIQGNYGTGENSPTGWSIQGSNNGSTWDTLDTRTGQSLGTTLSDTYVMSINGSYQYYRLSIPANEQPANYAQCTELRFYEGARATTNNTIEAFVYSGTALDFAPASLIVKDHNGVAITTGNVNVAYDKNGAGFTSLIDIDAFKALSASLFTGTTSLKIKVQPVGATKITDTLITTTSSAILITTTAVKKYTNSVETADLQTAYDHISNNGSAHSYINQSVTTSAKPTFAGLTKVGTSSNYTEIEDDGTLHFNGDATVFEDININILPLTVGGTVPGTAEINSLGIRTRAFDVDESVDAIIEIPHSYKLGSNITPHIHFIPMSAPTGTDQVKFLLTYFIVDKDGTITATTPVDTGDVAVTTQWARVDVNFGTFSHATLGGQLGFNLKRVTATGDAYAGECGVLTMGFHYEKDTVGSRTITTK